MTAPRRPYRIGCLVRGWWEDLSGPGGLFRVTGDGIPNAGYITQRETTNPPPGYHIEPLIPLSALQEPLDKIDEALRVIKKMPGVGTGATATTCEAIAVELRRVIDREVYGDDE